MATQPKPRRVEFVGTIADFLGAIRYAGNGDFQRVTIEVPRTEFGNSAGLLALTGRRIRWIAEEIPEESASGDTEQYRDLHI
jgi:hypothetical protein